MMIGLEVYSRIW